MTPDTNSVGPRHGTIPADSPSASTTSGDGGTPDRGGNRESTWESSLPNPVMTRRRRMGKPLNETLHLPIDTPTLQLVDRHAKQRSRSVGSWIRQAIRNELARIAEHCHATNRDMNRRELRRLRSSLTEIAVLHTDTETLQIVEKQAKNGNCSAETWIYQAIRHELNYA